MYGYGQELILDETLGIPTYYQQDGLGSTVLTTAATGTPTTAPAYDVYGKARTLTPTFGYAGEQADSTGTVYLRARQYDPELGRFQTMDPLRGLPESTPTLNRFTYVANLPTQLVDPTGNFGFSTGGKIDLGHLSFSAKTKWFDINGWNPLDWKLPQGRSQSR